MSVEVTVIAPVYWLNVRTIPNAFGISPNKKKLRWMVAYPRWLPSAVFKFASAMLVRYPAILLALLGPPLRRPVPADTTQKAGAASPSENGPGQ